MIMRGHCILYRYDSTNTPDESIINGDTVYKFVEPKPFVEPKTNPKGDEWFKQMMARGEM